MKKTLIALAVLAASGASFAQSSVTLTGAYAAGFESTKTAAGVTSSGFGTDTAAINLAATEDLGGGLKASASVALGGMARSATVAGENASLSLEGGFGKLTIGSVESAGQGITARAAAGAPGYDLHGRVFSANANIDSVGLTLPKFGDFTVGLGYVDRGADTSTATGLGRGTTGATGAQPSVSISLGYAAGPVNASVDFTSWNRKDDAGVASNDTYKNAADQRYRVSGNYDLGVIKIGAGYSYLERTGTKPTTTETLLGVSAPLGAVTVGLTYGSSKGVYADSSNNSSTAKKTGYTLGAQYNLSKRTNLGLSTYSWKNSLATGTNTGYRALLAHSF